MKRIFYITLVLPLIMISCQSTPEAFFSVDSTSPEVGQEVFFNNDSKNANRFEWDFGDGYTSKSVNPSHVYNSTGPFEVKLSAFSKNGLEDVASLTVDVKIPTLLEIEVREFYDDYNVADASVVLYSLITDWVAQTNKISEGFTDADGFVVFSNLDPFVYYVDVWETNHDNWDLKNEDIGFIRTPEVLPYKINRFIAYVDYVTQHKGDGAVKRVAVIKKLVRKAADKAQPDSGTEGWQELYNKSIRLK